MPARLFSPAEISTIESHLLQHDRYRDRPLIIAGTQVGWAVWAYGPTVYVWPFYILPRDPVAVAQVGSLIPWGWKVPRELGA